MNPATVGRCELAIYLFAVLLLLLQSAEDVAATLTTLL